MSKKYYTDYVRHALRFYTRHNNQPIFNTEADKNNWMSCHSVLKKCSDKDAEILKSVYSGYDTLADEVFSASKKYKVDQDIIWDCMKDVERRIALRRGLL